MLKFPWSAKSVPDPGEMVLYYHERTKHHYYRFAPSLGYLDWATQPNPFRRFEGSEYIALPLPERDETPPYDCLYQEGLITPRPVTLETLSQFFFYSLAISAWKSYQGSTWALRVNPSSGNLHPTEGYLVISPVEGLSSQAGVYHYAPLEHGLEKRTEFDVSVWGELIAGLPEGSFLVALSSIHWRESWKYGERAWRYCQHDAGHALAALRVSAVIQGWRLLLLAQVSDDDISALLGLDRSGDFHKHELESPDLLAVVTPSDSRAPRDFVPSQEAIRHIAAGEWSGKANPLSEDHHEWKVIDMIEESCRYAGGGESQGILLANPREKPPGPIEAATRGPGILPATSTSAVLADDACRTSLTAGHIVRQRRSAVAMDGRTSITREQFCSMLSRVVPGLCSMPWDCLSWSALVHLGLFVHRVQGLPRGLYALVRDPAKLPLLKSSLGSEFCWQQPQGCPHGLPLYLLQEKDVRHIATSVSCGQDIAGEGAFSCGMLAEFEQVIQERGAHWYRRLYWETGMIGQILYLEAEAKGIRATGIGCFFDNPVHEVFGLSGHTFQSLYHFTVGGPVEDRRLTTLPAYPGLAKTGMI